MASEIALPVVLAEGNDVLVFRSLSDLCNWVEAVDVDSGGFHVWDASGRVLLLSTDPPHGLATTRPVHVSLAVNAAPGSSDLALLLTTRLRSAGIPANTNEPVGLLIDRFVIWQGYSR